MDSVPCDFNTTLSFVFGLREFPVSPSVFNFGVLDTNICLGGLLYDPYLTTRESKNNQYTQYSFSDYCVHLS